MKSDSSDVRFSEEGSRLLKNSQQCSEFLPCDIFTITALSHPEIPSFSEKSEQLILPCLWSGCQYASPIAGVIYEMRFRHAIIFQATLPPPLAAS